MVAVPWPRGWCVQPCRFTGRLSLEDRGMEFQRLRGTVSAAALLPLRVFLGVTFLYAGLDKLLDPSFLDPASPSGIQAQLEGFTRFSPLAPLIQAVALPFPVAIGVLMALGEIAVGLGALTGILYRLAATGGAVISLTLLLTASWTVRPYYLGNDLPYVLGWVTLAAAGSGGVLVLGPWLHQQLAVRTATTATPHGVAGAEEAAFRSRRLFLEVSLLGALTLLVGAIAGGLRMLLPAGAPSGTIANPGPTSLPTGAPASATPIPAGATPIPAGATSAQASAGAVGDVIANVSDLASTSAIGFTVPSSGDPGGLIKLTDGTFVAYDLVCTHEGCAVTNYDPRAQLLECPCHGATFDAAHDAQVVSGPAPRPLTKLPLKISSAGAITIAS
jgi:thiosulfate dehydrogenase (quinone) large subunit